MSSDDFCILGAERISSVCLIRLRNAYNFNDIMVVGEGGGLVSESTINVLSLVDVHALSISYYCRYSYAWVQIAIFASSQVSQPQLIGGICTIRLRSELRSLEPHAYPSSYNPKKP